MAGTFQPHPVIDTPLVKKLFPFQVLGCHVPLPEHDHSPPDLLLPPLQGPLAQKQFGQWIQSIVTDSGEGIGGIIDHHGILQGPLQQQAYKPSTIPNA